jgi:hypothetical protein
MTAIEDHRPAQVNDHTGDSRRAGADFIGGAANQKD